MDLRHFLAALRQRLLRVLILDASARILLTAVVLVATAVAADFLFRLPPAVRVLVLVGLVGTVGWMAWRRLQRPLSRPMDDLTLARFTERRLPVLGGRLLSGIEGLPLRPADHQILADNLTAEAPQRLVPAVTLPRRLGAAIGAVAVIILASVAAPNFTLPGLQRFFMPLSGIEWARTSGLVIELDRRVVPADEPVVVSVSRPSGGDDVVRLTWIDRERRSEESRLVDGTVGAIARRQPLNLPPGQYRITAESGDALPVSADVRVVARPVLERITATLAYPEYTGRAEESLNTLACTALPGSRLTFAVTFRQEAGRTVEKYALMLGATTVPITLTEHGFRGELVIEQGGELVAVISDQDGIGPRPEPRFTVVLGEDRAPVVRLAGVRNNEMISARAVVTLGVEARDDYGLGDLRLRFALNHSAKQKQESPAAKSGPDAEQDLVIFPGVGGDATTRKHTFELATIAKAGDRVALVGVAQDRNTVTGPGIGRSEVLVLRLVSDEELRLDLDREIVEALERVRQSREDVARGLADENQRPQSARNAMMSARKAGDLLNQVHRRAMTNRLDQDLAKPVAAAAAAVNDQATPALAQSAGESDPEAGAAAARTADAALAEAEKQLQSLRQEGDLSRLLAHLIQLQRNIGVETATYVRTYLVKALDEAGTARSADLATRQRALADQLRDLETRLLASSGSQLDPARNLVRADHPADRLAAAAAALAKAADRAKAPPHQDAALAAMERLLELLRGSDADRALAERIGALADRQEQIQKELERGADPRSLQERQNQLQKETRELAELLENQGKDPAAIEAMRGAERDEGAASKAMGSGAAGAAAREAAAAAAQLREAQRQLGEKQDKKDEEKKDEPSVTEVLRILREVRGMQVKILNASQAIHDRIQERDLDFAAQRDLEPLAEQEIEISLRLRGEALPALEKMALAKAALERVAEAVERVTAHLVKPALGERGIILEKIALYEMTRLLDIVDAMPQGKPSSKPGGEGEGGGGQAPFPPAAELALLTAMQEEVARRTSAGLPKVAEDQKTISDLVELLRGQARPGTRPAILMERAGRATASAEYRLRQADLGLTTRHEQELAVLALRRILEEAEASQGGGSSNKPQSPEQQRRQDGKPSPGGQSPGGDPKPGDGQAQGQGQGNNQGSSPENQTPSTGQGREVTVDPMHQEGGDLHLPPERREQLRQALEQHLPPQALPLYRRYLELLEEQP